LNTPGFDLFKLALRQGIGISQQPTDNRTLTVIDVTDDNNIHLLPIFCTTGLFYRIFNYRFSHDLLQLRNQI
jgi:hypothetical protein